MATEPAKWRLVYVQGVRKKDDPPNFLFILNSAAVSERDAWKQKVLERAVVAAG